MPVLLHAYGAVARYAMHAHCCITLPTQKGHSWATLKMVLPVTQYKKVKDYFTVDQLETVPN